MEQDKHPSGSKPESDKPVEKRPPSTTRPQEQEEEPNREATVDQDPGERQKRNQSWQKEDPLAS
jgi:hypothetical protein